MKWRELRIERAPGVTPGLSLEDCGPGLNVVVGPNGIGKSTLSRAARATLWSAEPFERGHARGRVVTRGEEWTVEREGAHPPRWNGPDGQEPRRPDARFRGCFHLALEDLLRQGGTERAIARELRLEMSGRYDLDAVAVQERKRRANSHQVRAVRGEWLEARKQVERLEATAREILQREKRLGPLQAELDELQAASRDRGALEALLEAAENEAELTALREAAEADEPLLARFESQDDFERLADFERARAEDAAEVARLREEVAAAEKRLLALSLPSGGADGAWLREGDARASRIARVREEVLPPLCTDLAGLDAQLEGVDVGDDDWTRDAVDAARGLLDRRREARARLAAIEKALEVADAPPEPEGRDPWRAVLALIEWCTSGATSAATAKGLVGAAALAAALLAIMIGVSVFATPVPAWAYLGPLILVVGVALAARGARATEGPERAAARRRYDESGADAPPSWDGPGVRRALEDLLEARAERDFAAHLREWSKGLELQHGDAVREDRALAEEEAALRARLGADGASELDLRFLLARLEGDARRRALRAQVAALESSLAEDVERLQELLVTVGVGAAEDVDGALARWRDFAARAAQEPERRQAFEHAQERSRGAGARAARSAAQREAFLKARGLDEGDVERALSLAPRFAEHRERRDRLADLERAALRARKHWSERDDLLQLDEEALRARLDAGRAADDRVRELTAEIAAIEAAVRQERENTQLAQREVELRDAQERVEETRESVLDGVAMDELLLEVRQRHRQEGRPQVLSRADAHFADFTRNRYELEHFEDDDLAVVETGTRRRLSPDQLSSGTRTQLLIALRLAYAESIEGDDHYPIFLDEALLTSDPERFREVARSLGRMVADGRQVFYLTAEPREEVEWREALGEAGAQVVVHDLGDRLASLRRVAGSSLEIAALPEVPAPADDDGARYAEALGGMPPVDGFESASALHLLQLYWDRPRAAYRVLREHRTHVGAVKAFLDQTSQPPWDAAERERFAAYVRVADRVLTLWRVGRVPRLDAETLRGCGAAKSSKFDEVLAVAERVGWDGDALLAALEDKAVKGLQRRIIDELREDLESRERLAAGEPLAFDDLLARVLNDAEGDVERGALSREDARQLAHRLVRWASGGDGAPRQEYGAGHLPPE